jgi:hypothetical protein
VWCWNISPLYLVELFLHPPQLVIQNLLVIHRHLDVFIQLVWIRNVYKIVCPVWLKDDSHPIWHTQAHPLLVYMN